MNTVFENLRANFAQWEARGRGALIYPAPVLLEPPFVPFPDHRVAAAHSSDDGSRPTFLSRLADRVSRAISPKGTAGLTVPDAEMMEPNPDWFGEEAVLPVEYRIKIPAESLYTQEALAGFLITLSLTTRPMAFEIVGTRELVWLQVSAGEADAATLAGQLAAQFPDAKLETSRERLRHAWESDDVPERAVIDFGLDREFMLPLNSLGRTEPYASLIGSMAALSEGEAAIYQVLFSALRAPWSQSAWAAVTDGHGNPFFDDGAPLMKATTEKISRPLFGVVLRFAAKAATLKRTWDILRGMAPCLRLFSKAGGQSFVPLSNVDYDHEAHCEDLLFRRSRRCGMILNLDELTGLAHLPTPAVQVAKFLRQSASTRAAPESRFDEGSVSVGINLHDGVSRNVILTPEQRIRHTHIIGASGSGKTTLIRSMIQQDIEGGCGLGVLDPHGDLIDSILASVPAHRIDDVVLVDPADLEYSVGCNILSASSEFERTLLSSDLVGVFRRLSTSWGDQMGSVLGNAINAFLEHREGGTLADLRRFLVDPQFRKAFLEGVTDPEIVYYWTRTFPQLGGNRSLGPILTRLETFLSPKSIRCMVGQQDRNLNIGDIMDSGKILLIKLSEGLIGSENSQLLGSLFVMRIQMMALCRQRMGSTERRPFWLYIDEFQNFITPSLAEMLSGGRKYGLGLVLAHQQLRHLRRDEEVEAAVFANTFTRIMFRCSDDDSRHLEKGLTHFTAKEIQNLGIGEAIVRLERSDQDFNLKVPYLKEEHDETAAQRRAEVVASSRQLYSRPRSEVERELADRLSVSSKPKERPVQDKPPATEPEPKPASTRPPEIPAAPAEEVKARPPSGKSGEGVGGPAHRIVVQQLSQEAESLGFWTDREFTLPGRERVDLVVGIGHRRIAIEVAMTTNTGHEIGNLTKCLAGNFDLIVSVSPHEHIIRSIQSAAAKLFAAGGLTETQFAIFHFLSPAALVELLKTVAEEDARLPQKEATPEVKVIGGRRVAIRRAERNPEQRKIEDEGLRAIAEIISRSRPEQPPFQ